MPYEWTTDRPETPGWYVCKFSGIDPFLRGATMLEIVAEERIIILV